MSDRGGAASEGGSGRWVPAKDVIAELAGDHMVLIHMDTNRIFELNRTGARVWELLRDGEDADGIVQRMLEEFDVENGRLRQEVDAVLKRLEAEKLVRRDG
jgi:hypothetical protein